MLNIEKIKNMTKAAAYENGPEKKNIEISTYYRTDYLALQLLKSGVAYTVSFAIVVVLWAMGIMEELMLNISHGAYLEALLKKLIIFYILGLMLYEAAVYVYYSRKHYKAKRSVLEFHSHLKNIHKFYETQDSAEDYVEINLAEEEKTL